MTKKFINSWDTENVYCKIKPSFLIQNKNKITIFVEYLVVEGIKITFPIVKQF